MKLSRREVIKHLRNIMGTAGAYPLISSPLLGMESTTGKEHFFIFVELRGGVHHTVITDYPSIDAINKIKNAKPRAVMNFPIGDNYSSFFEGEQLTRDERERLKADIDKYLQDEIDFNMLPDTVRLNGYFCALPYDARQADNYYYQSSTNSAIRLGPAALSLANHADKMSVLRGVFMRGTFHGFANEEIYSGSSDRKGHHVAGVLAELLERKYGEKPMDNLVLGRAAYTTINEGIVKPAIQIPFDTIISLAKKDKGHINISLAHASIIAKAMQNKYTLSNQQTAIMNQYLASFAHAESAKQNLSNLNFNVDGDDARTDIAMHLGKQLDACLELFKNGMSRVLTVCVGQSEGFGGFDSHAYYYHDGEYKNFFNFTKLTIDDLAHFLNKIENKNYDNNKKWKDVLTVVVSSEFGRSNNFSGGVEPEGKFGNDHYYFNNNYIFYGKNVNKGQWIGASDPITRHAHVVDFAKLNGGDVANAFEDPLKVVPIGNGLGEKIALKAGYASGTLVLDPTSMSPSSPSDHLHSTTDANKRALMAKDVVRTIMAIAGVESSFSSYYVDELYQDAHIISALVS